MKHQILVTHFSNGGFMVVLQFRNYKEAEIAFNLLSAKTGRYVERLYDVKDKT